MKTPAFLALPCAEHDQLTQQRDVAQLREIAGRATSAVEVLDPVPREGEAGDRVVQTIGAADEAHVVPEKEPDGVPFVIQDDALVGPGRRAPGAGALRPRARSRGGRGTCRPGPRPAPSTAPPATTCSRDRGIEG